MTFWGVLPEARSLGSKPSNEGSTPSSPAITQWDIQRALIALESQAKPAAWRYALRHSSDLRENVVAVISTGQFDTADSNVNALRFDYITINPVEMPSWDAGTWKLEVD